MNFITIDKKDWPKGIDRARKSYLLFGPVKDENICIFKELGESVQPAMEIDYTTMSAKSTIFPQSEPILTANLNDEEPDANIMKPVTQKTTLRAVVGIRPYDAKALQIMKLNFDTQDYRDPYWCSAYETTTFVGLAINRPSPFDFSTSVGSGPFAEDGLDILLADMKDKYLAKILTAKGEAFASACSFNTIADSKEGQAIFDILRKEAESAITSKVDTNKLKEKAILDLHEAPFWDEIGFACINCGTCTFICPTCWCFDIQDETKRKFTTRFRNWDTCMSSLFTLHASGHNPRESKIQRVRQRFMHKLKYFLNKYNQGIMCVGCGRCVQNCPVNIDIREVCQIMNSYEKQT